MTTRGETWKETMLRKHGSVEAVAAEMQRRAAKGGKAKVPKGFSKNPEFAKEMAKKGAKAKHEK